MTSAAVASAGRNPKESSKSPRILFIAQYLFVGLQACLRRWLAASERPEWREGHKKYERFLRLQMNGLGQTTGIAHLPLAVQTRAKRVRTAG